MDDLEKLMNLNKKKTELIDIIKKYNLKKEYDLIKIKKIYDTYKEAYMEITHEEPKYDLDRLLKVNE